MSRRPAVITISIPPLPPDISLRLEIEAKARGTTVEALALEIIRDALRRADLALSDSAGTVRDS